MNACCVFHHLIHKINKLKIPTWQDLQLYLISRVPQVVLNNTTSLDTVILKICQKRLRRKKVLHNKLTVKKGWYDSSNYTRAGCHLPASSWWMRSAKFGSSPHQKSQSSRRPCRWLRRHTLSTSAFRQRLKLHRMGSSSVTGKSIGAEVGPCHTNLFHLIPVRSAWHTGEGQGWKRSLGVQSCCFQIHSAPSRKQAQFKDNNQAFRSRPPSAQANTSVWLKSQGMRVRRKWWAGL